MRGSSRTTSIDSPASTGWSLTAAQDSPSTKTIPSPSPPPPTTPPPPRIEQLEVHANKPRHEQEIGNVRVGDDIQDALLEPHLEPRHCGVGTQPELHGLLADAHLAPRGLREQRAQIRGDQIDDLEIH